MSRWRKTDSGGGWISIALHWLFALLLLALFGLGLWMVGLDYTHRWYYRAPALHEVFGILLAALLALRWLWRLAERTPPLLPDLEGIETPAGDFHQWLSSPVIALAALHALAASKHHFVDRDRTLLRMIGGRATPR